MKKNKFLTKKKIIGYLVILLILAWSLIFFYRIELSKVSWELFHAEKIALLLNPRDPKLTFSVGNYYFQGKAYDVRRAQTFYEKTLVLDGRHPGAHYQLARVYFIYGRFPKALEKINTEIVLYPDYKRSYYIRGLIYGYMGRFDEAANDFEEFLRFKPESWAGHNDLAWIYFQMGDYGKVAEVTESGLKYSPDNVWLLNSRGVALLNLGEKEEAKKIFEKALEQAEKMRPEDWGRAYPGNNPDIYPQGLQSMRESIRRNLELLNKK